MHVFVGGQFLSLFLESPFSCHLFNILILSKKFIILRRLRFVLMNSKIIFKK